jgi:hypothetical protein
MDWEGFVGNWSWLVLKFYPSAFLDEVQETRILRVGFIMSQTKHRRVNYKENIKLILS